MNRAEKNLIYGIHPVLEAVQSGKPVDRVLLKQGFRGEGSPGLLTLLKTHEIPVQYVPAEKLSRLTRGNHQGIIALMASIEYTELDVLVPFLFGEGRIPALVLLDGITDVRNMGAIARSAECAGMDGIVLPVKGSAQINPDAVKTSAGALNIIPVCRVPVLSQAVTYLKASGFYVVAATEKAGGSIFETDLNRPVALIIGSEDTGIDPLLLRAADELAAIPQCGQIRSLNVSAAASVIFYEIYRQRHLQG